MTKHDVSQLSGLKNKAADGLHQQHCSGFTWAAAPEFLMSNNTCQPVTYSRLLYKLTIVEVRHLCNQWMELQL